tara:strand:+ start:19202 stop:19582 length:381 start_codon:yes stop_codon:yes gene_type:complete
MKKTTTISARYNFAIRAIRAQGFRVSAYNGYIFATHPDTKEIVFSGGLDDAEKWIIEIDDKAPDLCLEVPLTQDPGFWQGIVFAILALVFSQIAIFGGFPYGFPFGPFAILFLFLAIFRVERKKQK